jgi:cytochrome c-type biogenesis protein CcmH
VNRRAFVVVAAGQGAAAPQASNLGPMDQQAYRPVRRDPKPGGAPVLTDDQRDALEHRLKCNCGCTLDVYTCRTTDFTCSVSPAMHRDVVALQQGGYDAAEILAAFEAVYGESVLMAPKRVGFNWAGYLVPFAALAAGAALVTAFLRRRTAPAAAIPTAAGTVTAAADADALARLEAAIRDDRDAE